MSITNPDKVVTKQDLADFYDQIKPYLGSYPVAIANKFSKSDIYSTSEKMIGQWTDGRPIYQKTFTGTLTKTTAVGTEVSTNISIGATVQQFVSVEGYVDNGEGTFQFISEASVSDNKTRWLRFSANTNSFSVSSERNKVIIGNSWFTTEKTYYFTVRFTKTTDSATSIGVDTDYSTTEKIVGTWIDGKPLYQKTINFGTLPNTTTKSVAHGITNLGNVIDIKGWFNKNTVWGSLSYASDSTNGVEVYVSGSNLTVKTYKDQTSFTTCYITIQYTKT